MNLGELVRKHRAEAGLTQAGLADACGTFQAVISQIECGHQPRLKPEVVEALRAVLGLSADELPVLDLPRLRGGTEKDRLAEIDEILDRVDATVTSTMARVDRQLAAWSTP